MKTLKNVLIVQPYGIGDLLFITPVLRALRLIPTVQRVDLLLGSRNAVVVRNNPHVDEIFEVDKDLFHRQGRWKTFCDAAALGKKLRGRHYDLLLDYSLRGEYGFFGKWFLGIPKRAGYDYKRRGFFHSHKLSLSGGFSGKHVADTCCELAEKAGVRVRDRWLEFYLDERSQKKAASVLSAGPAASWKRFAAVSPGGGESWGKDAHFKRWAPEKFAAFVEMLSVPLDLQGVVIVGGPAEQELSVKLFSKLGIPAADLTGELTLSETASVIEASSVFVGNDGGLLHLACARRKPVVGFYGPVDPAVYGPYPFSKTSAAIFKEGLECRPCYQKFRYKSDCSHRNCLTDLSAAEAFASLERSGFFHAAALNPSLRTSLKPL